MSHAQKSGHRYAAAFAALAERREGMFVPFVMLGDPTPARSTEILDALVRGGADAIEVGIPFSDPIADGPTIQAAGQRALAAGVTPATCLEILAAFRQRHPSVPVGILTYANLVVHRSMTEFYATCATAGVDSVLVADVPVLEAQPFADTARQHGIAPILIAPPNLSDASLERLPTLCDGYTYCVTRGGVTGADQTVTLDHGDLFARLTRVGAPPPVLGFGISRPEHVGQAIAAGAAGAISGSAVVNLIAKGEPETVLGELEAFVREMKAATRMVG